MHGVSMLAVAVAAVSTFVVGGLWYSPLLFGKRWQTLVGLRDEDLAQGAGLAFGGSFVLQLAMALNMALFLGPDASLGHGAASGFHFGFGFVALGMGVTYLFERRSLGLWLINGGYHAVALSLTGVILAVL